MTSNESLKHSLTHRLIRLALAVIVLGWVIGRVGVGQVLEALRHADLSSIQVSMLIFHTGVSSFSRPNLGGLLEISFDRALFPALFLCMVLAITNIDGSDEKNTPEDVKHIKSSELAN